MASVTTAQTKFLQKWNENVSRTVTIDIFLVLSTALTNRSQNAKHFTQQTCRIVTGEVKGNKR
jgi:hypothetical protein